MTNKEKAELDMKRKAERKIFQGIVEKKNEQLTKAKKIIKALLRLWNDVMTEETVKTLIAEAEQFLKEVEK